MPATARPLEKARGLACDAIVMDLEEAVASDAYISMPKGLSGSANQD
jgi:citrate lyase beta subunit